MYFGHYSLRKTWVLECIARLALEHLLAVNRSQAPEKSAEGNFHPTFSSF